MFKVKNTQEGSVRIAVLQNSGKRPGKHPYWCIFKIYLTKHFINDGFVVIFSNISISYFKGHLRTAVSEINWESRRHSFMFQ